MDAVVYCIADGRLWSVQEAKYIDNTPADCRGMELFVDGKPADEAYLIKTLEFYNFPLGELAMKTPKGIREKLAALDAQYLTPRVLGGLAQQDPYALAQWQKHEEEALPLRERLAELTGADNQSL